MEHPQATIAEILAHWDAVETWKPIEDFLAYQVSSWGRVRRGSTVLRAAKTARYLVVSLSDGKRKATGRVHVLVARAFLGPAPFSSALVAHNDGSTDNNRVSNLRWASALENQADRERHDTRTRGSEVFGAKLTENQIPFIRRRIAAGERYPSIARDFGVSISTVSLIKRGRIWQHV